MDDFEKMMEEQIDKTFDEAELLIQKLPSVKKLRSLIKNKIEVVNRGLQQYAIKIPVSVKVVNSNGVSLVYKYKQREFGCSSVSNFGIYAQREKGGHQKLWDIEDDELFLRCALTIPELLRKIKNEANRLKRELCNEIDAELEQVEIST